MSTNAGTNVRYTINMEAEPSATNYEYTVNKDNSSVAISKCTSSESNVMIPDKIDGYVVTSIGAKAFQNLGSIRSVSFTEGIKSIGQYAFAGCRSLNTLVIPKSLCNVSENAFLNSGITAIKYGGTSADWKKITIASTGNTAFLNAAVTGSDGKKFLADENKWETEVKVKKPSVSKVKSLKVTAGKKKLKLSWKKLSGIDKYQVQISLKKNFKGAKKISVGKSKKTYTKKGLKAKKKYYVRIRAYKKYKDINKKTKTVYGKWVTTSVKTR